MCDDDDLQRYTQQHLRQKCGYIYMALMEFPFFAPAPLDRTHCMNNRLYLTGVRGGGNSVLKPYCQHTFQN